MFEQNVLVGDRCEVGDRVIVHWAPRAQFRTGGLTMAAAMTLPSSVQAKRPAAAKKSRTGYLLLLPGMGWLAVFFAIPFVTLFVTSLQVPVPGTSGQYMPAFNLLNYPEALLRTTPSSSSARLSTPASPTILALIIAYPLAYFIAFRGGQWKGLLLVLVVAPTFASFLLRTYAWRTILADEGPITSFPQCA